MLNLFIIKNYKKLLITTFAIVSIFSFYSVDAQTKFVSVGRDDVGDCRALGGGNGTVRNFALCLNALATKSFVPYIFALALLAFAVAIFWYIRSADNESQRADAVKWIIWSVVGFFFMVSVWTFAKMFADFFGGPDGVIPQFK